jgi:acyl carrier protein
MDKKQIHNIVVNKVNELIDTLPEEQKFEVSDNTVLFGNGSAIDSLSLVSLIVDLEGEFSSEHGHDISLTDDNAMTRKISPFSSITNLVDYISELTTKS